MRNQESKEDKNSRQLDRIESGLEDLKKIINGNGHIGMAAKVNIMWNYRLLFVSAVVANMGTVIYFLFRGGN